MWFVFILCGIISGLMFSNVEEFYKNGTRQRITTDSKERKVQLEGCPTEIPLIDNVTNAIVAARIYENGSFYELPALSCGGTYNTYYAETKHIATSTEISSPGTIHFGSMIINPGCTVYLFNSEYNWKLKSYTGPKVITHFDTGDTGYTTNCLVNKHSTLYTCVKHAILFSCKQELPSCQPSDEWQTVTTLDNTGSAVPSKFTYTKTVGTTWSDSMTKSMGGSNELSAELSSSFFGYFSAKIGVKQTTNYDWTKADTETESASKVYIVEVTIPGGIRVYIEEAVGHCGGSTIRTQMFRVKDANTTNIARTYQGKITKYKMSKKDFKKNN